MNRANASLLGDHLGYWMYLREGSFTYDISERRLHPRISSCGRVDGAFRGRGSILHSGVIFQEFPNRISPQGRVSRAAEMQAGYEKGRAIMRSQVYEVKRIVESGDEIAVELDWTGVLAVPALGLLAGTEMRAFVAMFLTFRDGKIVSQRNYDCYPPLKSQAA